MSNSKLRIWKREELLQDNDSSKTLKCSNYSYKHKLKSLEFLEICRDLKNGARLRLCRPRRSLNTNRGWNFCIPLHFKWILHFWSAGKTAIAQTDINTICSQKELICKGYGGLWDLGLGFHFSEWWYLLWLQFNFYVNATQNSGSTGQNVIRAERSLLF